MDQPKSLLFKELFGAQPQYVDEKSVIPRVPEHLRMVSPESYKPQLVCIGLYRDLTDSATQADKCRFEISREYVRVAGITGRSWNQFCAWVVGNRRRLQHIYVDANPILAVAKYEKLGTEMILYTLTMDAIFQVGFILGMVLPFNGSEQQNDSTGTNHFQAVMRKPVFRCRATELLRDFFLLENQLPLFLLERVVSRLQKAPRYAGTGLSQVVDKFISLVLPSLPVDLKETKEKNPVDFNDCKHILDCLYTALCHFNPPANPTPSPIILEPTDTFDADLTTQSATNTGFAPMVDMECSEKSLSGGLDSPVGLNDKRDLDSGSDLQSVDICIPTDIQPSCLVITEINTEINIDSTSDINLKKLDTQARNQTTDIRTVTELKKVGIKVVAGGSGITDVQFQKGILKLPRVRLDDKTEILLRNLATYEYVMKRVPHVLSYLRLMDCLIDTKDDVAMLRREGVIDYNWLGSDNDAAEMWNKLLLGYSFNLSHDYARVMTAINKYCQRSWIEWYVEFKETYFSKPWLTMSVIVAGILVTLTIVQTIYALLAYY